jgi:hypothetical protein
MWDIPGVTHTRNMQVRCVKTKKDTVTQNVTIILWTPVISVIEVFFTQIK